MSETSKVLARLAREIAGRPASEPLSLRLCLACARILGADGAAITLSPLTAERVVLSVTDEVAARIEDLQEVLAEGPALQAFSVGHGVEADVPPGDTGAPERDGPWGQFARSAHDLFGPLTVYAVPIHAGRADLERLGVLVLYRRGRRPWGHLQDLAQVLADAVGAALLREPADGAGGTSEGENIERPAGWSRRARVHQATGMVVAQLGLGPEDALALLRAHAYAEDRSLDQIAEDVVGRRLDFTTTDTDDESPDA